MRNEGQIPQKARSSTLRHASCSMDGLLHSSGLTTDHFQAAVLVLVLLALDCSTGLHGTWLWPGLGSAPFDLVHRPFVPPPASSTSATARGFCWAQLCSLLGAACLPERWEGTGSSRRRTVCTLVPGRNEEETEQNGALLLHVQFSPETRPVSDSVDSTEQQPLPL